MYNAPLSTLTPPSTSSASSMSSLGSVCGDSRQPKPIKSYSEMVAEAEIGVARAVNERLRNRQNEVYGELSSVPDERWRPKAISGYVALPTDAATTRDLRWGRDPTNLMQQKIDVWRCAECHHVNKSGYVYNDDSVCKKCKHLRLFTWRCVPCGWVNKDTRRYGCAGPKCDALLPGPLVPVRVLPDGESGWRCPACLERRSDAYVWPCPCGAFKWYHLLRKDGALSVPPEMGHQLLFQKQDMPVLPVPRSPWSPNTRHFRRDWTPYSSTLPLMSSSSSSSTSLSSSSLASTSLSLS
jgi:hypothetical protein